MTGALRRSVAVDRVFPAWLLTATLLALVAVQVARAVRGAPEIVAPLVATPTKLQPVMTLPPKPEGLATNAVGTSTGEAAYTAERCAKMGDGGFADACWAALARDLGARDVDGGLDACGKIGDRELRLECTADVAEAYAPVDVVRSRAVCETIPKLKWRDQCVFGIASAFALKDPAFALKTCEDSGQWKPFCRHDVNGARAQVDVDGAIAYCAHLDPALQDTCWHGIGKYVARIDPAKAIATCDEVPTDQDFRGQCFHGVGWAVAEDRGPAAISACEDLGAERDSCVLGVAYHTRRFDRDEAAKLCEQATDPAERGRCLEVARRPLQ